MCVCVSPCVFWSPRGRWRNLINKNWSLGKYDQSRKLWTFRMEATWKQWETGSNLKVYFLYKKNNHPRAWRSQTPAAAIAKYPSCLGNPVDTRPESHVGKAHAVVHQFRGRGNDFGEARWWKEAKSYLFCERHQISRIPVKEKLPHRLSSHCLTSRIASPRVKNASKSSVDGSWQNHEPTLSQLWAPSPSQIMYSPKIHDATSRPHFAGALAETPFTNNVAKLHIYTYIHVFVCISY